MKEIAVLANPKRGHKRRGHRRSRRNPDMMLINPSAKQKRWAQKLLKQGRAKKGVAKLTHMSMSELNKVSRSRVGKKKRHGGKKRKGVKRVAKLVHKTHKRVTHRRKKATSRRKAGRKAGRRKGAKKGARRKARGKLFYFKGRVSKPKHRRGKRGKWVKVTGNPKRKQHGRYRRRGAWVRVNPKAGLKSIVPLLTTAAWAMGGFFATKLVANLVKKYVPIGLVQNDLVANAVAPLLLTLLPIKLPNKEAILTGAYVALVHKLAMTFLPAGITGFLGEYVNVNPSSAGNWWANAYYDSPGQVAFDQQMPSPFGYGYGPDADGVVSDEWGQLVQASSANAQAFSGLDEYVNAEAGASAVASQVTVAPHFGGVDEIIPQLGDGLDGDQYGSDWVD